jgi:hypothetical protein
MSLKRVWYRGVEVNPNDIVVQWTDCFGEPHTGSIEDYSSDYAAEEVGIALAGEGW